LFVRAHSVVINSLSPMPEFAIRGVIPAVLTPFAQDGALDTALLQAEVAALDSAGVDAFCIGSVVGETVGSAPAEFGRICGAASAATRKPVLAAIYPDSTVEGLHLADAAVSAGAAAVLLAQPHYLFQPDVYGLEELFLALRRYVRVPLLLSNSVCSAPVPLAGIQRLAESGLIDGVHQACDAHLLADLLCVQPRLPVLGGIDDLMYIAFLLGAEGAMTSLAAVFPDDSVSLYAAVRGQEYERARRIHEKLTRVWRSLNYPDDLLARLKFASAAQGRPAGIPRSPYDALPPSAQAEVTAALAAERELRA